MRIKIDSTWLAPGGRSAASALTCNGRQIVDRADFFRALAATFYARGNREVEISFTVEREHGSLKAAEVFLLTHYGDLPRSGDVVFYCGTEDDEQAISLVGAVLEAMPQGVYLGRSTRVSYTLRGGIPTTDIIPDAGEIDDDVTRRDTVAISETASEVEVTFANPMTGTPTVVASVVTPSGGDILACTIEDGSVSATGFTAKLSFPAPASTYKLAYIAIL